MDSALVGIPIHEARVSPVFDVARQMALFAWADAYRRYAFMRTVDLDQLDRDGRVERLRMLSLNTLICGAISRALCTALAGAGIQVIPLITGPVDDVIGAFACQRLCIDPRWHMPGSPYCRRRRHRGCQGREHGGGPARNIS